MKFPTGTAAAALALLAFAGRGGARQSWLRAGISDSAAERHLVICNAYPSNSSVTVTRNGQKLLVGKDRPLRFKECRRISSPLAPRDTFAFVPMGVGTDHADVEGNFEVGDLPQGGAALLLVFAKRNATSPLASFQSFAFQPGGRGTGAQLAVIDTYRAAAGPPSAARPVLIMTGQTLPGGSGARLAEGAPRSGGVFASFVSLVHRSVGRIWPGGGGTAAPAALAEVPQRHVQELKFGHVYALERGSYDASVVDRAGDVFEAEVAANARLAARDGQASVILRVGDGGRFGQSLVAFHATLDETYLCSPKTDGFCGFAGLLSECEKKHGVNSMCSGGSCICKEHYCADGHGKCQSKAKAKELPTTYRIEVMHKPGHFLYFKGDASVSQEVGYWEGDPGPRGHWHVVVNNDDTVMLHTEKWGTDYWLSLEQQNSFLLPDLHGVTHYASWTAFTSPQSSSFEVLSKSNSSNGTDVCLKDVRAGLWVTDGAGVMIGTSEFDSDKGKLRFHPPLPADMIMDGAFRAWPLLPLLVSMCLLVL